MKILACLVLLFLCGCHSFREQSPVATGEGGSQIVSDTLITGDDRIRTRQSLVRFYAERDFLFFWSDGHRFYSTADSMIAVIKNVHESGLIAGEYHMDDIEKLLQDSLSPDRFARMDVLLSDGFLTLYHHLQKGRLDPATLRYRDLSHLTDAEAMGALQRIDAGSIVSELESAEPEFAQYKLLKEALRNFGRATEGDSLRATRAEKIALNLERWRWQSMWPDRYVFVNVPAFSLRVVENDSVWLKTAVIVGKRDTPTPVLRSVIRSFTIYPYWHVPRSIATKEILPALQADGGYLRSHNFDVLDKRGSVIETDTIEWRLYSADKFPFILRQREGSENSMGIIKFDFANNYNVYLHDTNSRGLFRRAARDLSHGCVRVQDAVSLAHYLVREDDIYVSPEDLDQYLSIQQRLEIPLRKPIPVRLEYFTAEVENGVTFYYDDVYKKDSLMIQALYRRAAVTPVDKGPNQSPGR